MATPDFDAKPQGKTLYEIAAEKQALLGPKGTPFVDAASGATKTKYVRLNPDGSTSEVLQTPQDEDNLADDVPPNPFFDTLFLALPLSALFFTLSVLTIHQYAAQDKLSFLPIARETILIALSTLFLLIHLAHGHLLPIQLSTNLNPSVARAFKMLQQVVFVLAANVAGCYLIYLTNDRGYYAVMKRAPAVGTLWVWSVIELGLVGAVLGVVGPGIYAWYNGYGVY